MASAGRAAYGLDQTPAALCNQLSQACARHPAPSSCCTTMSNLTPALHIPSPYVGSPGARRYVGGGDLSPQRPARGLGAGTDL